MGKLIGAALVICLGSAAFAYGPLLPWSPVKPGYNSAAFPRADVYFSRSGPMLDDYREIDSIMREAEIFHRLQFHRRVRVIACKNWADCDRALPWLSVRGLGGVGA